MNSIMQQIVEELSNGINKKIDDLIVVGLSLKGYSFNSRQELESFIKDNCTITEFKGVKVFKVKDVDFLELHINPNIEYDKENPYKVNATAGYYRFL